MEDLYISFLLFPDMFHEATSKPQDYHLQYKDLVMMYQAKTVHLDTENEKQLGKIVHDKYHTDFYILYRYPKSARPFYTMPDPDDENFTNSYDAFVRGEEVLENSRLWLVNEKDFGEESKPCYFEGLYRCFKLGAPAHGGVGIGLERVVKLFTGIKNIKKCVMFPRDPKRLNP